VLVIDPTTTSEPRRIELSDPGPVTVRFAAMNPDGTVLGRGAELRPVQ